MEQCFVSLSKRVVIDVIRENGSTLINGNTLEEIRERYPDAQQMSLEEAKEALESNLIGDPERISKEQFIEALEVLPPESWRNCGETESFKMSEYFYGNITSIYVRIGNEYFSFNDRGTLSHDDIIRKVAMTQVKTQATD